MCTYFTMMMHTSSDYWSVRGCTLFFKIIRKIIIIPQCNSHLKHLLCEAYRTLNRNGHVDASVNILSIDTSSTTNSRMRQLVVIITILFQDSAINLKQNTPYNFNEPWWILLKRLQHSLNASINISKIFVFVRAHNGYFFKRFWSRFFLSQSVLIDHYTDYTETSYAELDYASDIRQLWWR